MAKSMFKPDVALDGLEFSAVTRIIEAAHNNKELASEDDLDTAKEALQALKDNSVVSKDAVKVLADVARKYKDMSDKVDKEGDEDAMSAVGQFPNVKGGELKRLVKKLEGLEKGQETKDDQGKKVHPAAMPAGDEHLEDDKGDSNFPRQGNDVPKLQAEPQGQDQAARKTQTQAHALKKK